MIGLPKVNCGGSHLTRACSGWSSLSKLTDCGRGGDGAKCFGIRKGRVHNVLTSSTGHDALAYGMLAVPVLVERSHVEGVFRIGLEVADHRVQFLKMDSASYVTSHAASLTLSSAMAIALRRLSNRGSPLTNLSLYT